VPLLANLTFGPALEHALSNNEVDKLEVLISTPDRATETIKILRAQVPFHDAAFHLLKGIIQDQKMTSVDLSGFHISEDQIITLFSGQQYSASLEILDISHNDQITIQLLPKLLPLLPELRRLILFKTAVTDQEILKLVQQQPCLLGRVEGIIRPAFLKNPVTFSPAFTHICGSRSFATIPGVSIPYFSPDQMVQMLSDFYEHIIHAHTHKRFLLGSMHLPDISQAAFCTRTRKPGKSWGQRIVPFLPHMDLQGDQ